ncbi:MAG: DUF996 domain-containing protein [Candidatus Bathyarchaeota archaeon]|nr:DUF996 domain-containing protein [Candidatus Bathyarchaeota archaeon]
MATTFEYSKTLAMEGSILLLLGLIPYVGWALGIVGVILLLRAMREFSNFYQDNSIYQNSLTGVKYYIIALIALAVSAASFVVGFVFTDFTTVLTVGNALGIALGVIFIIVAFVFYVLAATNLRKTFSTLAQKTGEHSFETAGALLWVGSILTIIVVGLLLILIAWIFAIVGFFAMKSPYYTPQPYANNSPPTQPPVAPTQTANHNSTAVHQ